MIAKKKPAAKAFQWNVAHGKKKGVVAANTQIGARKKAALLFGYKRSFPMATISASIKR